MKARMLLLAIALWFAGTALSFARSASLITTSCEFPGARLSLVRQMWFTSKSPRMAHFRDRNGAAFEGSRRLQPRKTEPF
jgi:hypothetical protein